MPRSRARSTLRPSTAVNLRGTAWPTLDSATLGVAQEAPSRISASNRYGVNFATIDDLAETIVWMKGEEGVI